MDLTLPMVFTVVALFLHNYYVLGLMAPIQFLKAKFHSQIFQMDILKQTTLLAIKLIYRTALSIL